MNKLTPDNEHTLRTIRTLLLGVLIFGCVGTLVELLLLAHYEDAAQLIPIVLLGAGLLVALWNAARPAHAPVRMLQIVMLLFIVAGCAGTFYHYQANVEFQREIDPTLAGTALLWKVLQAKAPPALSPGVLVQLALIGFTFSFKHPALAGTNQGDRRR